MDQIKTTETIVINGTESWENLGEVTIYESYQINARGDYGIRPCGSVPLIFKHVPGLGNRFAIVYKEKVYALVKNTTLSYKDTHNVFIPAIQRYLNIEEFNNQ